MEKVEQEARRDMAIMLRDIETNAKEEAEKKAAEQNAGSSGS